MSKQLDAECGVCKRSGYISEKDGHLYCGWCGSNHPKTTKVTTKRPPAKRNKEVQ